MRKHSQYFSKAQGRRAVSILYVLSHPCAAAVAAAMSERPLASLLGRIHWSGSDTAASSTERASATSGQWLMHAFAAALQQSRS